MARQRLCPTQLFYLTLLMERILVVDDEMDLREILQFNLESAGYAVDTAASAEEALTLLTPQHALILLDVMMGGMSGLQLARLLRQERGIDTPIIFLTALGQEDDLLQGFSLGADDYITKPFSSRLVLARVQAVLRRATRSADATITEEAPPSLEGVRIDHERKLAVVGGQEVKLSPKEFGILSTLVGQPGRIFSREEILALVWQGEAYVLDRTVDVHIARVRRKLGAEGSRITNRQGYGYCFE